jgi:hypothetical protein
MRVQKNGKVRRSPDEWQKIFERFRSSDLSEAAFCRRENISKSSFAKWKRRIVNSTPDPDRFIELTSATSPKSAGRTPAQYSELEIRLPDGIVLHWRS